MKKIEKIEVGDFIEFKGHIMAVIAINENNNHAYALCNENHKMARFDMDEVDEIKIVKKSGCKSLIRGIYDDMTYGRM